MKNTQGMRPTSGKVLSALMNILASAGAIDGEPFLDLFAGTGAAALAAIENGASSARAVEIDPRAADAISRAAAGKPIDVVRGDVRRYFSRSEKSGERYGVVFADPPYSIGWGRELPALFEAHASLVKPGGAFVFERSAREDALEISLERDDRRYGETVLSFYWIRS